MELSEYNGWENKFTWLMHLHLSNEQALMDEVMALVASQSRDRAAGRLLNTWVATTVFNWLCVHPDRESYFDAQVRLLVWDMVGSVLAYAEWQMLVALLIGRARKSDNLFTMTLYRYILTNQNLLAFVQEMVQAFPSCYQCADMLQEWFREQVDTVFERPDMLPQQGGFASLVHALFQDACQVVAWEHVARAFRPGY